LGGADIVVFHDHVRDFAQTMDQADDHDIRFTTQQGALIRERLHHCCGLTVGR
jgi:hypothetical protein